LLGGNYLPNLSHKSVGNFPKRCENSVQEGNRQGRQGAGEQGSRGA